MDVFFLENEPKVLTTTKRPRSFYVVGPDMDFHLCKTLVPGDQILLEVNGNRYWSATNNPLVAEHPWEVVENMVALKHGRPIGQLILRHPKKPKPLILNYNSIQLTEDIADLESSGINQPVVFIEPLVSLPDCYRDDDKGSNAWFVIPQMIAYRIPENQVEQHFPGTFDAEAFQTALADETIRDGLYHEFSEAFQSLNPQGWHLGSVKRFALRAHVRVSSIGAFRHRMSPILCKIKDEDFRRIRQEKQWYAHILRQNDLIQHAPERVVPSKYKQ